MKINNKKMYTFSFILFILTLSIIWVMNTNILNQSKQVSKAVENPIHKYNFIYSHPFKKNSYLISTDNGNDFKETKLNFSDIFSIQNSQLEEKNLLLFPTHENKYYQLDDSGKLNVHNVNDPLTFYFKNKLLSIQSLNTTVDNNLLKVIDNEYNKKYSIELPSYLDKSTFNKDYIIVITNKINDITSLLHVINRKSGKLQKSVELTSPAVDLIFYNNQILITTEKSLSIISLNDFKVREVKYPLQEIMVDKIAIHKDKIFISYGNLVDGSANLLLLNSKYKVLDDIPLNVPYSASKFRNNKFYVLSQFELDEDEKFGGQLNEVDLSTLEIEKTINLPKKEIKVQDFEVFN
ncbi:hypothetical protein ABGT22_08360 [Peribacillus frigoritolerans]|uniref:hypothetical protein n=1 Tax=Peribacillus frigoritolerans TaxID=450367 RepID=UPI00345CA247